MRFNLESINAYARHRPRGEADELKLNSECVRDNASQHCASSGKSNELPSRFARGAGRTHFGNVSGNVERFGFRVLQQALDEREWSSPSLAAQRENRDLGPHVEADFQEM